MNYMFYYCSSLTSLNLSNNFKYMNDMLYGCSSSFKEVKIKLTKISLTKFLKF